MKRWTGKPELLSGVARERVEIQVVTLLDMKHRRATNEIPEGNALGDTGETLAFHLSRSWMRFHDAYADALRPLHLTPSRMLGLAFLVHNDDADQAILGRTLGINRASTMTLVDKLQAAGYVARSVGSDRRTHALVVTVEGRTAYRRGMVLERQIEKVLLKKLSAKEVEGFRACLAIVASSEQESANVAER